MIDVKKIRELVDLMEEKDLHALEVGDKDRFIKLTKTQAATQVVQAVAPQAAPTAPVATAKTGKLETSPMVGVFYSAPSPNDPPFVKVGQSVQKGQQLGIIEAMKIMNPLEASQDGIIDEILVKNGDVVQFDQPVIRYKS